MAYERIHWENNSTALSAENMNNIEDGIEEALDLIGKVASVIYPVGSIYMSTVDTDPGTFFGGTWVPWGSGRVPVGVDAEDSNFNDVEKEGGSEAHTHTNPSTGSSSAANTGGTSLSVANLPSHTHTQVITLSNNSSTTLSYTRGSASTGKLHNYPAVTVNSSANTGSTGSGTAHSHTMAHTHTIGDTGSASNLQPYITCYMFKRTA